MLIGLWPLAALLATPLVELVLGAGALATTLCAALQAGVLALAFFDTVSVRRRHRRFPAASWAWCLVAPPVYVSRRLSACGADGSGPLVFASWSIYVAVVIALAWRTFDAVLAAGA